MVVEHAEDGPVGTRIRYLRHVAPRQRDPVSAINRAQIPGRIGIEEMPVGVLRNLRHAAHHDRGRERDLFTSLDAVRFARKEAPEWHLRTQQRTGEEAALEIAPRMK